MPDTNRLGRTQKKILGIVPITEDEDAEVNSFKPSEIAAIARVTTAAAAGALRGLQERGFFRSAPRGLGPRAPIYYTRIA